MSFIRFLQRTHNSEIVFREPTISDVFAYAILFYTWGKKEFCAKQAAADRLQYFWVDTCCIDKKNAVELGAAINSMFRWYQNAARCYVYFLNFTRSWTFQELIALKLVDFFSLKTKRRTTTIKENKVYCLIGIFDVSIVLNYEEKRNQAFRRLKKKIYRLYKRLTSANVDFEQFAVGLNFASFFGAVHFVAKEIELSKMHNLFYGYSSRFCVVLHSLRKIKKTQLAITYTKRHKEKYTAIFYKSDSDAIALIKELNGLLFVLSTAKTYLKHLYKNFWLKLQMTLVKLLKLLLRHRNSVSNKWIKKLIKNKTSFQTAMKLLSFVLNKNWDKNLAQLALNCIASERRLLSHVTKYKYLLAKSKVNVEKKLANAEAIKLSKAEKMYTRALQKKKNQLGPNHTFTFNTVNNFSFLYTNQTLKRFNKTFKPKHISTLDTTNNLASAEAMYFRALEKYKKTVKPNYTSTLATLADAKAIYTRALKKKEKALRPKYTSTLDTLTEAEKMYILALRSKKKALGLDHLSTLDTVNNLTETEKMYIRALQGKEKALKPKYISTLDIVNNLGLFYVDQGKLIEAEHMYAKALEKYKKAPFDPENISSHILALNTMFNLGELFKRTFQKDRAKALYNRALSGFITIQRLSSEMCSKIRRRLRELQFVPDKSEVCEDESTEIRAPESKSLKRKHSASWETGRMWNGP
ncbi:hypothetical protein B0O99DRAFT_657101 [Bisporella sp. PMI_857]|nr:hypothetical protein B0O99DRAFT_657101 [Bisporella sp. PMI_857]